MDAGNTHKGKFIVFEGMDGSGKSTAIELAYNYLKFLNIPVIRVRVPGGTNEGERLRSILLDGDPDLEVVSEFMLMQVTRIETYNKVIKPAINAGTWVICDRFNTSSYVYQHAVKGMSYKLMNSIIEQTTPDRLIDLNVLIRRPFDDVLKHLDTKIKDHFEAMSVEKLERAYTEYEMHALSADDPWTVIDNIGTLDELTSNIEQIIDGMNK